MKKTILLPLAILLFICLDGSLKAQVPSPHNFPHAYGNYNPFIYGPAITYTNVAMGMDGHVVFSFTLGTNQYNYVLNKGHDAYMTWNTTIRGSNAIQKNSHVWLGSTIDARICTIDTLGTVLNQFKIGSSTLVQIVADTMDHIYVVYDANSTSGFGVVRFGAGFVPDWHQFYPGATATTASWGIDQRLYVTCLGRVVVVDANGTRLKDLMNVSSPFTVFQDHGLGMVSYAADTIRVVRTDSNMALRWARKFKPTASFWGQPMTLLAADGTAAPGSNDLNITSTVRITMQSTQNCNYPYTEEIFNVVLDANGNLVANRSLSSGINEYQATVVSSPFGDPIIPYAYHSCLTAANVDYIGLGVIPGYNLRQACGGFAPNVTALAFAPASMPTVGALGTTTVPALTLTGDNLAFGVQTYPVPSNTGSVACVRPCLTVTATAMGGGQVAFNDQTYGFYTIQYAFGDGTFGNSVDPTHQYPGTGNYTCTVIATNACGADTFTIPVNPCVVPQFGGSTMACLGVPTWFTETSGLANDSLRWLVNGAFATTGDSLQWTPPALGVYQIGLVYADAPCRDTTFVNVTVSSGNPTSAFTYTMVPPLNLQFSNQSTNAVGYSWTFGDGGTSTLTNPNHHYNANGSYNICLAATNGCGVATSCQTWSCPFPTAAFTVTSSGNVATITNSSTNATSYAWDFGDGTTGTGAVSSHTYTSSGTFNICLYASSGCLTDTICHTITVVASADDFYRITHTPSGFFGTPQAMATNDNGFTCVVGSTLSNGSYLSMVDTLGNMLWHKGFFLNYTYFIRDAIAMPNGNFLLVGSSAQAGGSGSNDGFWVEMDVAGNFINGQVIGTASAEEFTKVVRARDGGYLLAGFLYSGGGLYVKLNSSLQMQWSRRLTTLTPLALFQAPDMTHWLVARQASQQSILRYIHLDNAGVEFEQFAVTYYSAGTVTNQNNAFEMTCDGMIYGASNLRDNVPGIGNFQKMLVHRFNTVTKQGNTSTFKMGGGVNATAPLYDCFPIDLVVKPDGNLLVLGQMNLQNGINTTPYTDRMLVHVNPNTLATNVMGFGITNNGGSSELFTAGVVQENGLVLAAGINFSAFEFNRFGTGPECQLQVSALGSPNHVIEATNPTALTTITNASTGGYGVVNSIGTGFNPQTVTTNIRCASPCNLSVTAGFTYTISGNTVTFTSTSTPGSILNWSLPGACSNGGVYTTNPTQASTFTTTIPCGTTVNVSLTAINACGSNTVTQTISIPGSSVTVSPSQTVCPGGAATFTATPGMASYLWSSGQTTNAVTVTSPGTYTVTATDINGCVSNASTTLSNYPAPAVSVGPNQSICTGATAIIAATTGFSGYLWNTGATTASISATTAGTYSVTVTDANGCTATASTTLSIYPAPAVSVSPNQTICTGTTAIIAATPGFSSYLWNTGATTASISATAAGTYSVTVTDANGCTATASTTLSTYPAPVVSVGPNQTVCSGTTANFAATPGFSGYSWNTGATAASISATTAGTYSVTVTDANGCTATASASLTLNPPPTFSLGPDTTICPDTTVGLSGPPAMTAYLWSTNATSQNITVGLAGTYSLTVTDANGCTASDEVVVTVSTDCVWPGDANHDGIANNLDILAVGYGFGFSGPLRPGASPVWYGQQAPTWGSSLPNLVNHKHTDCDGNGTIDFLDTVLVAANYGLTHLKQTEVTTGLPLWVVPGQDSFPVGDTVFFEVHWGDGNQQVLGGHGLAFGLQVDAQQITPGSMTVDYPASFLGTIPTDMMSFTYPVAPGQWDVAITRIDRQGRNGAGAVMRVVFLPDVVYPLTATLGYIPVRLSTATAYDGDFNPVLVGILNDSVLVYDPVNAVAAGILIGCRLYPSPADEQAVVELSLAANAMVSVTLSDMHGRRLAAVRPAAMAQAGILKTSIDTRALAQGVYLVQATVNGERITKRLVVER